MKVYTAAEFREYLNSLSDDKRIDLLNDDARAYIHEHKGVLLVFIWHWTLNRLAVFGRDLLKVDEARVSTLMLLLIIWSMVGLWLAFTTKKIDPGIATVISSAFYSTAAVNISNAYKSVKSVKNTVSRFKV